LQFITFSHDVYRKTDYHFIVKVYFLVDVLLSEELKPLNQDSTPITHDKCF
jgi:hypothetical protein